MTSEENQALSDRAEQLYNAKIKALVEHDSDGKFIAIEPDSGDYFLGDTLSRAVGLARDAHPNRLSHVMRVGHKAAIHFGMQLR
ncbi:MAG: hypothetical protein AAGB00_00710 [Planctomycetota bacterium]